jgi:hypothetical protein
MSAAKSIAILVAFATGAIPAFQITKMCQQVAGPASTCDPSTIDLFWNAARVAFSLVLRAYDEPFDEPFCVTGGRATSANIVAVV